MNNKEWIISENAFLKENVEANGSRYLIGNGYMGYRGTLEEFTAEQLVALNMAGLFDRNGEQWRESVNAPNPFYTVCSVNGKKLHVLENEPISHSQILDFGKGIHSRTTDFKIDDAVVTISAQRFLSMQDENLAVLKYTISSDKELEVNVNTSIDTNVWSINGAHFDVVNKEQAEGVNAYTMQTVENAILMKVYEKIYNVKNETTVLVKPNESFTFIKVCGVYWGEQCDGSLEQFLKLTEKGYDVLLEEHSNVWNQIWEASDVKIDGDAEAQQAIRYSIYHLCSIAPRNTETCGIPARGLSGQVYKGAAFWDTEMFMLPFFTFTDTNLAKNLVKYRLNTIGGAKRKAKEFGYEGAFYAWESQETGDDACTFFNVSDIFTGRPMRTYFRDRQIHVSADMVYGFWEYCTISGDYSLLSKGGLDMIYQCLLFYYSYACYKPLRNRYEILNVVGPDEYHERVDNNAFTNRMICYVVNAFNNALAYVKEHDLDTYATFTQDNDISWIQDFTEKLYVPEPNEDGIIEQFDGYFNLEDVSLDELRSRVIIPNEYWGGGNGLATTTRILKQADVVMMLNVFRAQYDSQVKKANWVYYEPYTEHGSSLSACAYAIVAAEIGMTEWAYKYFMKTATVDITRNTKQYLGSLYIGGTHPAANGGSWNTAIFGFGGVSYDGDTLDISPRLPEHWNSLQFNLLWQGVRLNIVITKDGVKVTSDENAQKIKVTVNKKAYRIGE